MITNHRVHDPRLLVKRWRNVCKRAGLKLRCLAKSDSMDVFYVQTPVLEQTDGIYISAGIHGDEPAATEALISWAEKNWKRLTKLPLLIFPCLNPSGLNCNRRTNAQGEDLNRLFHLDTNPVVSAIKRVVGERRFTLALNLHEDYDGQGLYLYEVGTPAKGGGEQLLKAAAKFIPLDRRTVIDGTPAKAGLIRRRYSKTRFDRLGHPEAIWLHLFHADHTFTVEAPSEFALNQRVEALIAVIEKCTGMTH